MKKKYTNLEVGDLLIEREWTKAHNDGVPFFSLAMIVGVHGVVEGDKYYVIEWLNTEKNFPFLERYGSYGEVDVTEWRLHYLAHRGNMGL
jgi:hypothetical protein